VTDISVAQDFGDPMIEAIQAAMGGAVFDVAELDQPGLIPTRTVTSIWSKLAFAVANEVRFALVHGPAGVGKTESVMEFARNPAAALAKLRQAGTQVTWNQKVESTYLQCLPHMDNYQMLIELARVLKASRTINNRYLIHVVRDALALQRRMVVLDEAQRLNLHGLDTAKYLADTTGTTFVLITMDEYVPKIRQWRDIESRIGVIAQVGPVTLEELQRIYEPQGWRKDALQEIHMVTGGIMRDVVRLIRLLERAIELNGKTPGDVLPLYVRAAASQLHLTGGRR
jgi:DNA transposition AAA+ family ATPase